MSALLHLIIQSNQDLGYLFYLVVKECSLNEESLPDHQILYVFILLILNSELIGVFGTFICIQKRQTIINLK